MYFHKVHTGVLGPTRFPSRVLVTMHTSAEGTNTDAQNQPCSFHPDTFLLK